MELGRERENPMTSLQLARVRALALALAVSVFPMIVSAQEPTRPERPSAASVLGWKLAYARRIADEGMEGEVAREKMHREAMRQWRKIMRERAKGGGLHARHVVPDPNAIPGSAGGADLDLARRFGSTAFPIPANTPVNDPAGDDPDACQSETSIAVFGDILVAAWNDGQGTGGDDQGWATSADGGATWTDRGTFPHPVGVAGFAWLSDPSLTVNEKSGAFYFSALCRFTSTTLGPRAAIGLVKGRWNGTTVVWGNPAIAHDTPIDIDEIPDKNWCVADSATGNVYLSYTQFHRGVSRIMFEASDSNAVAWSAPAQISLEDAVEPGFVQGSRPVVDGDGHVYVVYHLIGQSFADFYKISRSNDHGVSFAPPVVAESLYTNFNTGPPGFNRDVAVDFSGIAVDRSHGPHRGRVYLSWAESLNWLDEVFTLGQLGHKDELEPNGTPATATPITLGQTVRGVVAGPADADHYALSLVQGQSIVVSADSTATGAYRLWLLAGDGTTELTFTSFDSGVNGGFPIGWLFTAPSTGTYYVRVRSAGGTGPYRLRTGEVHRGLERGRDQRDVFVAYSDDGSIWSDPARLSEDAPGFDAFTPEVAVAPDGVAYCSWYDYRDAAPQTDGGESSVYLARSGDGGITWTPLGPMSDTRSNWSPSVTVTNLLPNQGDYMILGASTSFVWSVWSDARRGNPDVFAARTPLIPNGAQVVAADVRVEASSVAIDWSATPADTLTMRVYRSIDGGPFVFLAVVQFSATGALTYLDATAAGEHAFTYRLGRFTNGVELFSGQVSAVRSGLSLLSPRPNPIVAGTFVAAFALPTDEPAQLILYDVTGREVLRRTVAPGRGPHTVALAVPGDLHQGLYILMLRQGGRSASTRAYLVR
jgi:hypothetical protein